MTVGNTQVMFIGGARCVCYTWRMKSWAYDVKLDPVVLHLLSSLCRSLRRSLAPLRFGSNAVDSMGV